MAWGVTQIIECEHFFSQTGESGKGTIVHGRQEKKERR